MQVIVWASQNPASSPSWLVATFWPIFLESKMKFILEYWNTINDPLCTCESYFIKYYVLQRLAIYILYISSTKPTLKDTSSNPHPPDGLQRRCSLFLQTTWDITQTQTQFSFPLTLGYQILITTPRTGINFTMLTMLYENIVQNVERVWIFWF